MAEIALGLVISAAVSTATNLVASALQKPNESTRLSDITPIRASYGDNLPVVYGRAKLPGFIFWSLPLKEYVSDNVYKYKGTCAVAFCQAPDAGVFKIEKVWANKKLVYQYPNSGYLIDTRLGTAAQPMLNEILIQDGANNPRFKNVVYLGFINEKLQKFGMSLPNFEAEVWSHATSPTLEFVLTDVCKRAGLATNQFVFNNTSFFNTALVDSAVLPCDGSSVRNFIEELQIVYDFTMREINGVIQFTPTMSTNVITLPAQQMGVQPETQGTEEGQSDDDTFKLYSKREEFENDLPSEVQLEFKNTANSFRKSTSNFLDPTRNQENQKSIQFSNVGFNDTQALAIAQRSYDYARYTSKTYDGISLPYIVPLGNVWADWFSSSTSKVTPGQAYRLTLDSGDYNQFVTGVELSPTFIQKIQSHDYYGGVGFIPQPTTPVYNTDSLAGSFVEAAPLFVETSPLKTVTSTNEIDFLVGANTTPPNFAGGYAYVDQGATDVTVGTVLGVLSRGTLTTSLPKTSHYYNDEITTFDVNLVHGTLSNITSAAWLNGEQILLVGQELILVREATLLSPNNYRCKGLVRGWQGTETLILNTAPIGTSVARVASNLSSSNSQTYSYGNCRSSTNLVPIGTNNIKVLGYDLDEVTYNPLYATNVNITGRSFMPFAPILNTYNPTTGVFTWSRRTRGFFSNDFNPPLNEGSESYQVRFFNSTFTTQVGLFVANQESLTLNFTQILTVTQPGSMLYFRIHQVSEKVGIGFSNNYTISSNLSFYYQTS